MTRRWKRDAWGLASASLLWGLLFAIIARPVEPLSPPALGAPVPRPARQVALVVLEGVPDEAFSWPALIPFFEDVLRRGCGGRLSGAAAPLRVSAPPSGFPYGTGTESLVALLRRAGRRVLGTGPAPELLGSIAPWARTEKDLARALDTHPWSFVGAAARVAPELDGALKVNGVATPRARAILDEDRRIARIAGILGSGGPVVLVYGSAGQGYRWAAAGPGIRPGPGTTVVSSQALVGTVAAVLGLRPPLAQGAQAPPILEFPTPEAGRRLAEAWNGARRQEEHDRAQRAALERQREAGLLIVLLGLLVSVLAVLGIRFLD